MKILNKVVLLISVLHLLIFSSTCFGENFKCEIAQDSKSIEKLYVSPEQILISEDGIFLFTDTGVIPVQYVSIDSFGLYVAKFYRCPACGRMNEANVCYNPRCPLYGI